MKGGNTNTDGYDIFYARDVSEVLRQQVAFCGKDNSMFRLKRGTAFVNGCFPKYDIEVHLGILQRSKEGGS